MERDKKLTKMRMKKLADLTMAMSEEQPKTKDELYDQITHYDKEVSKLMKGYKKWQHLEVFKLGLKGVDKFKEEPELKNQLKK